MPILLKTEIERTAKTPVTACRARVGGLCRFRRPAERVPAGSPKTGRCTAVRERCGNGKRRRRTPAGGFRQREKPQAAKQEKGLTLFCVRPSTSARSAGSFGSLKLASLRGEKSTDGVSFPEKPCVAGLFKDVLQQKGGIE